MSWRCRLTPAVQSVTCFLNPKDPLCFGVRNFWRKNMAEIRQLNPTMGLHFMETTVGEPVMQVIYTPVDYRFIRIAGATEEEIEDIMASVVSYGDNHAVLMQNQADDGGDPVWSMPVINFGFADSHFARVCGRTDREDGMATTDGVDDPGQKPRLLMPRNNCLKLIS
jgi:hypothetical protein